MATPITWSSATSVTGAASINSDPFVTAGSIGFSGVVQVAGTGAGGISGQLSLQVANGGVYAPIAGSQFSVLVNNGATENFSWSYETFYEDVELVWIVGSNTAGELQDGAWSSVTQVLPIAPALAAQPAGFLLNQAFPIGTAHNINPYGIDINCLNDLDPYFSLVGGIQCLAQDLYHLITINTGSLFWAPGLGYNAVSLLNQSVSTSELAVIQSNMTTALLADERVQGASVGLKYIPSTQSLITSVSVKPLSPQGSPQPFQFVASISAAGNNLLSISPALAA